MDVPLDECGTGISQVLAILYIILNSDYPRVVLIDEPHSFLHPGAVRKLIDILKEHSEHQYILASHSPTVITSANPSTITLLKMEGAETTFQAVDPKENEHLRQYLAELGARLSDVFGADNILWVEGPTEELCFPLILEEIARIPLMGTAILAVQQTGDFVGRHARSVFEIYKHLSKGRGLLPPAIGFVFDREGRSDRDQEDLTRQAGSQVYFLPRRMYENYLLHPAAIAAVANRISDFRKPPLTEEEVATWLKQQYSERDFGTDPDAGVPEVTVHAAKLLQALFTHFSEGRVEYHKTEHSVALTRWLIRYAPDRLRELADLLSDVIRGEVPTGS